MLFLFDANQLFDILTDFLDRFSILWRVNRYGISIEPNMRQLKVNVKIACELLRLVIWKLKIRIYFAI